MSSDTAIKYFVEKKASCSQAVFSAYGEQLSLGKVDHDTCMKIASAFCGGIANMGNVCGALTGALMALGLKYGVSAMEEATMEEGMKIIEISQKLLNEFKSLNGSIICRELINNDLVTDEDIKQAFKKGAFNNCPKYVEDTLVILEKLL